jgi:hypothetical protein
LQKTNNQNNYIKIVGSDNFVKEADKYISKFFTQIKPHEIKESNTAPGTYFTYVHVEA